MISDNLYQQLFYVETCSEDASSGSYSYSYLTEKNIWKYTPINAEYMPKKR